MTQPGEERREEEACSWGSLRPPCSHCTHCTPLPASSNNNLNIHPPYPVRGKPSVDKHFDVDHPTYSKEWEA